MKGHERIASASEGPEHIPTPAPPFLSFFELTQGNSCKCVWRVKTRPNVSEFESC